MFCYFQKKQKLFKHIVVTSEGIQIAEFEELTLVLFKTLSGQMCLYVRRGVNNCCIAAPMESRLLLGYKQCASVP